MKALVLCGGKGTRLRPLTYSIPKQLIPIANRPVVHYVMDHLRDVDIREVGVIVAPETAEQVKTALADNPWRFALSFILQDQPLSLAQTLQTWWLDCGKKDDLLEANRVVLDEWIQRDVQGTVDGTSKVIGRVRLEGDARVTHSEVRGPAVIGARTVVDRAFIGPYTSIGQQCVVRATALEHCVLLDGARVEGTGRLEDSVVGRNAIVSRSTTNHQALRLLIGDDAEVTL